MSKSETQILDFEKICRLCLLEKRSMSAIFSKKKSDKKVPLPVRIMSCASLELYEGDGLPASICSKCLLSVNQSYAFREQCEQADTTLRQYSQRMTEVQQDSSMKPENGESRTKYSFDRFVKNGKVDDVGCNIEEKDFEQNLSIHTIDFTNNSKNKNIIKSTLKSLSSSKKNNYLRFLNLSNFKNIQVENEKEFNLDKIERGDNQNYSFTEKEFQIGVPTRETHTLDNKSYSSTFRNKIINRMQMVTDLPESLENRIIRLDPAAEKIASSISLNGNDESPFNQLLKIASNVFCSTDFENQLDFRFYKNLLKTKNKTMEAQKGTASYSSFEIIRKKLSSNFEIRNKRYLKKDISFPYNNKAIQMWKELVEIKDDISKVTMKHENQIRGKGIVGNDQSFIVQPQHAEKNVLNKKGGGKNSLENPGKNEAKGAKAKRKSQKDTVYCPDCRIFLLRSSYNNHIKFVHKKVRKYLCQECGYAACTGTILRQHVQAVHVGYSFFCDQCPKKFNLMKRLRRHLQVQHSDKPIERNHVCQYCGMAFVKPASLKRHLRSHTQETPYQCQYCQRRFKYRWPKVQHERLHTGEKPYKCSFCEERFTQNCVRKAHEYKKHGNENFKPKNATKKKENVANDIYKEN